MTPEVLQAVSEIRQSFPESELQADEDGQGGAFIDLTNVDIGEKYSPQRTWLAFHITFQYPRADVYPLFISPDVRRVDGAAHGAGITPQPWRGKPALQLSRRSNRLDPNSDTAVTKLAKVIAWLKNQ